MAVELVVTIVDGKATVQANGTASSCALARELEKALGGTKKVTPTGTKPITQGLTQG